MNRLKKIYAATSVLFFFLLAVSPLKEVIKDWQDVQESYNDYTENLPYKVKKIDYGLKQIWNRDLEIVDRCITCHVNLDEKKLNKAPQPFTSHPNIYHDPEKFGCTICHDGQGLSTNYEDAHLSTEFWDRPLLPTKYIETACFRCHDELKDDNAPLYNKGKRLVEKLNCIACHDIPNISINYSPDLNGIGRKIKNKQWLINWLKNPLSYSSNATMPNFLLSDIEAEILAYFLMSFKDVNSSVKSIDLPEYYKELKDDDEFINLGKKRFREARCISCHAIDGKGGKLSIDLFKVASKATEEWIFNYIKNPKALMSGVKMPQYGFTDKEAAAITAYIESEFVDWDIDEDELQDIQPVTGYFEKGIEIFNKYNCAGCHRLDQKDIRENKGPELTSVSSKKLYQIEWGNVQEKHTLYEYFEDKLKFPSKFGKSTRMPVFNLNDEEISAITAFLLTLRDEKLPKNYFVRSRKVQPFNPQGKIRRIFNKYSCLECHSVNSYGGKIAPDLAIVGSQLNREWTRNYFNVPYSLRPIVEERMPNLFIDSTEIDELLDYFESVFIDDDLEFKLDLSMDFEELKKGEMLFKEKYGCQSCHIIDGSGGYVGPPLENVGDRLKPAWIYSWIQNPQKYKPNTIEPNAGMNKEDLILITSYLAQKRK